MDLIQAVQMGTLAQTQVISLAAHLTQMEITDSLTMH